MEPALPTLNEDLPVVYMGSQLRTACINRLQIHDVTAHTGILTATHIYMHLLAPAMARIIPLSLSSYQLSSAAMLRKAFVQLAQVGQRAIVHRLDGAPKLKPVGDRPAARPSVSGRRARVSGLRV